jgi:hypothetical protein
MGCLATAGGFRPANSQPRPPAPPSASSATIPAARAFGTGTPSSSSGKAFSAAVSPGSRLKSWNTYPITRRRSRALRPCGIPASGMPRHAGTGRGG